MGRLIKITYADGAILQKEYSPDGNLKTEHGAGTYPVASNYDAQGWKITLTTWQDYSKKEGAMLRQRRVQCPGAIDHDLNRGNFRESIFKDDQDHECFVRTLADARRKACWQVHAVCLMPNHEHGCGWIGWWGRWAFDRTTRQAARALPWKSGGQDLAGRRKTGAKKTSIGARLRSQTVMTLDWSAKRLKMGYWHTTASY
ncbi:MAG TPA: hypothetical protein P5186_14510 [Candidatus Paceibacterota bacterium]|nr:hypothetical protein [Verrucomicrobiota bacterium]HRY49258.1 hypothetical protein [Candidatus Paceibacterota bacterium]HRZ99420.1 hypothetical protein [Candidatus Paceibacterota bacterium]